MLERKYGGRLVTRHAARTIQTAFRQYQMNKNFERLRSSMSENRMSRRIVLSNMRMQFSFEGPEKVHSSYFEGKQVSVTNDGSQLGALVPSECGDLSDPALKSPAPSSDFADAITELEDAFSRQVKSLAESIDDALNCRSLHSEEVPASDTARARDTEPKPGLHGMDHRKLDEMTASYSDVTLYIDEEELSPPLPLSQAGDRPSSTESDLRLRSGGAAQDYWALAHKEDKADTDTSCRSTPSLERPEPRLRVEHLPLLTIEPPSDSSVELSDRSDRSSLKRQSAYERSLGGQQGSPKHGPHGGPPKGLPREEPELRPRPPRPLESHLAINGSANRQSKSESDYSDGDNDSINSTSNSNDTINCSSESSSRDSLREQTLSKQTYHKETRNSWDSPAFSNDVIRKRHYRIGLNLFNKKPEKGIQYLIEHKLLTSDVQDIAQFLYKGDGLNKTAIGTYLGEKDPINLQVLQAFVDCHEFANLNLVQALRQFLWSFRLPGEAQKIDRMMEAFAARYCLCNPGVFRSTDTCYVLSFSVIMLNTGLHNPNVRDRPPFERFVTMNRGINSGSDLPEEQLRNLFDSIKSEPFSIPEDDGGDLTHTFFNPDREGWLLKLGGRVKTWKRRWFILTDNCLYYFEFTTDKEPRGIIPLENLSVQKVEDPKKPFCLELYNPSCRGQKIKACKTDGDGKVVEGKHESYRISAANAEERDQWIEAIRASITRVPFYDLLSARKKKIVGK